MWPQIITWILIIFGWLLLTRTNDNRESRKEERNEIDRLTKLINEAVTIGIEFYTHEKYNSLTREKIIYSVSLIESSILRVPFLKTSLINDTIDFKASLTLTIEFEKRDFKTQEGDSDLILDIFRNAQNLIDGIEKAYRLKYTGKPFYKI